MEVNWIQVELFDGTSSTYVVDEKVSTISKIDIIMEKGVIIIEQDAPTPTGEDKTYIIIPMNNIQRYKLSTNPFKSEFEYSDVG